MLSTTKASLDLASHVLNFVHTLAVFLYSIHFVSMVPVDCVHQTALHAMSWVYVSLVHKALVLVVCRFLTMIVGRENASKCVAHLQLSVKGCVEASHFSLIKAAVASGMLCHWAVGVVLVIIRKA